MLIQACYGEDEVSKKNGITPDERGTVLKAKVILPRIVGAFEAELETATRISRLCANAMKAEKLGKGNLVETISRVHDQLVERRDAFIEKYHTNKLHEVDVVANVYTDYAKYRPIFDQGKKIFIEHLTVTDGIDLIDAKTLYEDYKISIKKSASEEEVIESLKYRATHQAILAKLYKTYPFHGQVVKFKKHIKQFADEKFAVTVLSLPVLGAMITTIIPLFFSICIAFTAWDESVTNYTFGWSVSAFSKLVGLGGNTDYVQTFGTLLYWTLIWAFFATFTNYIFGIIVALMINKRDIQFKKLWRTVLVITIAIPQFITLLSI